MISIVLAEDQNLLRGALRTLLAFEEDLMVVATADDGMKALRRIEQQSPDILVADIEMPELSGIELAEHIQRQKLETKTVIVTTFGRIGYLERARKAGVRGYLLKDAPIEHLVDAIRTVHSGGKWFAKELLTESYSIEDPLTDRDRRILRLVEQGKTNKEIGAALNLSPGTVRNYLSAALEKLDVSNRIEGFRIARENGWL